jgi:putative ABC transport system substrate-binding protein
LHGYPDYRTSYIGHTPATLIEHSRQEYVALWPAIAAVIEAHLRWAGPVILEGWHLDPAHVASVTHPQLRACWLLVNDAVLEDRLRADTAFYYGCTDGERFIRHYLARSRWANDRVRRAENQPERYPDLAMDHVRLPVDIIVAGDAAAALAAQHATSTIPIVMAVSADPVRDGLVASLARPGGNITGLSIMVPEVTGKRLELLAAAVPGLSRVALLMDTGIPSQPAELHDHEAAARGLGVQLLPLEVRDPDAFAGAFQAATQGHAQALIMMQGPLFSTHRGRLAELALASRLPTMAGEVGYAQAGGLMNYGPNLPESWHRAATYVDKILKGAKPAELPVEQPITFELVINLKTAQALGLTIPPTLFFQATEVIR